MTLVTKAAPLRLKQIGDDGTFEGYGSIFNVVDTVGDVVVPGAYAATLARHAEDGTRPKGLWQHDPTRPILSWVEMREDAKGLWCKGRLILDVEQAREAHALMKAGELDGLSIGFECTEIEFARPEDFEAKYGAPLPLDSIFAPGSQVRVLKGLDLWEVSLVTFPACRPAKVESVKSPAAIKIRDVATPALSRAGRTLALRHLAIRAHI